MKTASDIILEKDFESDGFQSTYTYDTVIECMKEYAEQFIDAAAEVADFREMTYEERKEGELHGISDCMGDVFTVDKGLILSLKEQLK